MPAVQPSHRSRDIAHILCTLMVPWAGAAHVQRGYTQLPSKAPTTQGYSKDYMS